MGNTVHKAYHIIIENGKKVQISNCQKILEYSPERITLLLCKECIRLIGENLSLYDFYGNDAQVSGNIRTLEILSSGNEEKKEKGEFSK